jgi:hypothetical protein
MRLSHEWGRGAAVFDDENLMSCAGLVPVMELAKQTGLSDLLDEHVVFRSERIRSGAANPAPKLTSVIAGLLAGADSIDDLDLIRAGGMKRLFCEVYAPATMGILLREFTGGHVRQLQAVQSRHLLALAERTGVLDGIATTRALVDSNICGPTITDLGDEVTITVSDDGCGRSDTGPRSPDPRKGCPSGWTTGTFSGHHARQGIPCVTTRWTNPTTGGRSGLLGGGAAAANGYPAAPTGGGIGVLEDIGAVGGVDADREDVESVAGHVPGATWCTEYPPGGQ